MKTTYSGPSSVWRQFKHSGTILSSAMSMSAILLARKSFPWHYNGYTFAYILQSKKDEHGHALFSFLVERTSVIIFVHSQGGRGVLAIVQQIRDDSPLSAFADNSAVCTYMNKNNIPTYEVE